MKKIIILVLVVLVAYFLIKGFDKKEEVIEPNGTPGQLENGEPFGSPGSMNSSQSAAAQLAAELKIAPASVVVTSVVAKEWTDSCLGLGGPAESCATVITPGYEVTLSAGGKTYVYRTDITGSVVRKQS